MFLRQAWKRIVIYVFHSHVPVHMHVHVSGDTSLLYMPMSKVSSRRDYRGHLIIYSWICNFFTVSLLWKRLTEFTKKTQQFKHQYIKIMQFILYIQVIAKFFFVFTDFFCFYGVSFSTKIDDNEESFKKLISKAWIILII